MACSKVRLFRPLFSPRKKRPDQPHGVFGGTASKPQKVRIRGPVGVIGYGTYHSAGNAVHIAGMGNGGPLHLAAKATEQFSHTVPPGMIMQELISRGDSSCGSRTSAALEVS
jgi:hypothetical protein